jgi:hypothetical protein
VIAFESVRIDVRSATRTAARRPCSPVAALAPDGHGEVQLSCCVSVGDVVYVGTDDARVLRVGETGDIELLRGFEAVAGRDTWYAGSAVIDGQGIGPPLGIRSITVTADRRVLLANVHVGGRTVCTRRIALP